MDYLTIYQKIVTRAKARNWHSRRYRIGKVVVDFPVEVHHILPRSINGKNDKSNLVVLTLKEHFITHLLLTKIYPNSGPILMAFNIMCNRTPNKTAQDYAILRSEFFERTRKRKLTQREKDLTSARLKKQWKDPEYRKKMTRMQTDRMATKHAKENFCISSIREKHPDFEEKQSKGFRVWSDGYWTDENKKLASERIKEQHRNNPELQRKRLNAIEKHANNKSDEWKKLMSELNGERMRTPEWKKHYSDLYWKEGNKFNNSRKVIDIETGIVYTSISQAAKAINMNYSTLKKRLYNNSTKTTIRFYK